MFKNVITHNTIRKYTIALGNLFSDLHVIRRDSNGNPVKDIHVPIAFADKHGWYRKRQEDNLEETPISTISFPRMFYDLVSITKDHSRQLSSVHALSMRNESMTRQYMMKNRVPHKFTFEFGIGATELHDALNILEQIVYLFSPSFTMELNEIPELDIISDIPITLLSITRDYASESNFEKVRVIIYKLSFELDGYIYPPVAERGLVTKEIINIQDSYSFENISQVVATALGPNPADGYDTTIHRKEATYEDPNVRVPPFYGDFHHSPLDSTNV